MLEFTKNHSKKRNDAKMNYKGISKKQHFVIKKMTKQLIEKRQEYHHIDNKFNKNYIEKAKNLIFLA